VADPEDGRREALKAHLEIFKHVATLDTATAVVLLTIYREGLVESIVLAMSLGALGVSLIASLYGMGDCAALLRREKGRAEGRPRYVYLALSSPLFVAGLVTFAIYAFGFLEP
jgi:hypothetical protein